MIGNSGNTAGKLRIDPGEGPDINGFFVLNSVFYEGGEGFGSNKNIFVYVEKNIVVKIIPVEPPN